MEKYINLKSTTNVANLKFVRFLENQKVGQFFSEPGSTENTPKNMMRMKLEPLDKATADQKMSEKSLSPSSSTKSKNGAKSLKSVIFSKNSFLMSALDEDQNTPKEEKKSQKKSRFSSKIPDNKNTAFKDSPSNKTEKPNDNETETEPSSFTEAFGDWETTKKDHNDFRIRKTPHTIKGSKFKDGMQKSQSTAHVNNNVVMSDNELSRKETETLRKNLSNMPFRHLVFSPSVEIQRFHKHLTLCYKGLLYAINSLRSPSDKFLKSKQVTIPDSVIKKSKTLALDLDETLIHACSIKDSPDTILSYESLGGEGIKQLPVKIRPHLKEFFQKLSPLYEIIVFTASAPNYAKAIVNHIDPDQKYINAILTRDNCMETKNGFFIKDLRIIKNRELSSVVIVDNLVHSFGFQIENGVPILEYFDDKNDKELKYLIDFFIDAYKSEDLRTYIETNVRLRDLAKYKLEDLLSTVV